MINTLKAHSGYEAAANCGTFRISRCHVWLDLGTEPFLIRKNTEDKTRWSSGFF